MIDDSEFEEGSDSDDEEMAMYARRFRRVIKKNKLWKNKNQHSKDEPKKEYTKEFKKESKKDNSIIFYNCNKPGHVKQDCKIPKKHSKYSKKSKGKAMVAT